MGLKEFKTKLIHSLLTIDRSFFESFWVEIGSSLKTKNSYQCFNLTEKNLSIYFFDQLSTATTVVVIRTLSCIYCKLYLS